MRGFHTETVVRIGSEEESERIKWFHNFSSVNASQKIILLLSVFQ